MTAFKLTVPPSVEPVLLADAKQQARIDTTADDNLVTDLITGARQWAENYLGRALITQTWQLWLDIAPTAAELLWDCMRQGPVIGFEALSYVALPRAPLQSVNSVTYFDYEDNAYVWPVGNYYVDTIREPGRLALRSGCVWPVPTRLTNGIVIEYIAGYGNDGTSVPEPIKTAIRQLVAHWYENRGDVGVTSSSRGMTSAFNAINVPIVIQALLDSYRLRRLSV